MSTIVARGSRSVHSDDGRESSIAAQVHDVLMERILDMELPPFQELSEARLAAEFGVSRTPVREALARLARRGLVDILPQRGTIVSPLSHDRIAKSRFIREALAIERQEIAHVPLFQQPIAWAARRGIDLRQAPDNRLRLWLVRVD